MLGNFVPNIERGSSQQDITRGEPRKIVRAVFCCEEIWQRHLERREALHADDVAAVFICKYRSRESYWHGIEIWRMFEYLIQNRNRYRIEDRFEGAVLSDGCTSI